MISGDGRFVAFVSRTAFDPQAAANTDQVYVRDMQGAGANVIRRVSVFPAGGGAGTDLGGSAPVIALGASGNAIVAFTTSTAFDPNDSNGVLDVYVRCF